MWTQVGIVSVGGIEGAGKSGAEIKKYYHVTNEEIEFETKASFEPDIGNRGKSIANIVVQTTDGQRVPITITNAKSVGFKKEWWQFWKK